MAKPFSVDVIREEHRQNRSGEGRKQIYPYRVFDHCPEAGRDHIQFESAPVILDVPYERIRECIIALKRHQNRLKIHAEIEHQYLRKGERQQQAVK